MSIPSTAADSGGNDIPLAKFRTEISPRYSAVENFLYCVGPPRFRTQGAHNLACLLDLDRAVESWCCLPLVLAHCGIDHVPDFLVKRADGMVLVDASSASIHPTVDWCREAAEGEGFRYERHVFHPNLRFRLENARELLAYASHPTPLRERLLLLASLDEYRSLPLSACMHVIRDSHDPIAVIAAMTLRRFVEIDLDKARIGPDTRVSRRHD